MACSRTEAIGSTPLQRGVACIALLAILASPILRADSWLPPKNKAYVSQDGNLRLTVIPRDIESPLAYYSDKVDHKERAGALPGDTRKSASGLLERRTGSTWETVWRKPLVNEVAPVEALVADNGRIVTFDNWGSTGYGDNVIATYDAKGERVNSLTLTDVVPEHYMQALPHSVSSLFWKTDARLDETAGTVTIQLIVPSAGDGFSEHPETVQRVLDLTTGRMRAPSGGAWPDAVAKAEAVYREIKTQEAAAEAAFIAPLPAPVAGSEPEWHDYLREAFFRTDPNWKDDFPATAVLVADTPENLKRTRRFVENDFKDQLTLQGVMMIASNSQDALVELLNEITPKYAGKLDHESRIYVAVDAKHDAAARAAIARTGAVYIHLDIDKPIPQNPERLRGLHEDGRDDTAD
ncbi:MAG: hypothetical protein ABWX83_04415 [Luteibacter sp.]